MSFIFINYPLAKVMFLLIRCYKSRFFLCSTNNTDRNGGNKQNIDTPNPQKKIILERISMKTSDARFFKTTPYFTNPSLFMEKI